MQRSGTGDAVRVILVLTLVVVLGLGLLYAYRSQTPAIQTVPITQAVQEVQRGNVRDVTYEANHATLTLSSGEREQTNLPDASATDPLEDAVIVWNRSNPTRLISLRRDAGTPSVLPLIGSILLSLLPLVLLIALILFAASAFARARRGDAYEQLARIADLRDRGVLTEEEFQREKRRLLR